MDEHGAAPCTAQPCACPEITAAQPGSRHALHKGPAPSSPVGTLRMQASGPGTACSTQDTRRTCMRAWWWVQLKLAAMRGQPLFVQPASRPGRQACTTVPTHSFVLRAQAMDGTLDLAAALEARLQIINCSPSDIKRFIQAHPPASRLAPVSGWVGHDSARTHACAPAYTHHI